MADTVEEAAEQKRTRKKASSIPKDHVIKHGALIFTLFLGIASFALVLGIMLGAFKLSLGLSLLVACIVALIAVLSLHICMEWERVVVVRFGKFVRLASPGLFFTIPLIELPVGRIDQRITAVSFEAEEALTADLVPVDVDAVLYWCVWDAQKACTEIRNYAEAVTLSGQTALRDAIGRIDLANLAMRRQELDFELQNIVNEKTKDWGISIISVEIRNISIPAELQDAMSKEAQAVRERNARITLAEVEKDISEMFVEAAEVYAGNENAMRIRAMNLLYESLKEKGGMVIAPSSISEAFKDVL